MLTNNILAFGSEHQLRITKPDRPLALHASRNVFVWTSGRVFEGPLLEAGIDFHHNLYSGLAGDFLGHSFEAWTMLGQDPGSLVGDPGFADPLRGDFTIPTLGATAKIGFVPFDLDGIGPVVRP